MPENLATEEPFSC